MSFVKGLKCRECGAPYKLEPIAICEECFGPLEVDYDYDAIKTTLTRDEIAGREKTMWRYRELLPLENEPTVGLNTGCTPLVRAERLAAALGVGELFIKNDAVQHPTLSFKDRVVAVALSKAREFKFEAVGCASTGNLANSVAANAAAAGFPAYILIPDNLEKSKVTATQIYGANVVPVKGNYDDVNRLCSEIAGRHPIAFVNVNLRPFYGEGSKTFGYEIAEQLGWEAPDAVVVPMAGGSLITKIYKAFGELSKFADHENLQSLRRTVEAGIDRRKTDAVLWRASHGLQSYRRRRQSWHARHSPGQTGHHCQIAGHWKSGRWVFRHRSHYEHRRVVRRCYGCRNHQRDEIAGRNRRHLYRNRRRYNARSHQEADRTRPTDRQRSDRHRHHWQWIEDSGSVDAGGPEIHRTEIVGV